MWVAFALASPFFWAIVHVLDSHCVQRVFDRPWMGVITSSLASLMVFAAFPFFPADSLRLTWQGLGLALAAGCAIQLSQALYFAALEDSEAGIVAAFWNLVPALLPMVHFGITGDPFSPLQYVGIAALVASSVLFNLLDVNGRARRRCFVLMGSAACLQVAALMLEKATFDRIGFRTGFFTVMAGIVLTGAAPLLAKRVRAVLAANSSVLRPAIPMLLGIEGANLLALFCSQRAISLGIPSFVAAVEASLPAYATALSVVLLVSTGRFGDPRSRERIPTKLGLTAVMAIGVWCVSQ